MLLCLLKVKDKIIQLKAIFKRLKNETNSCCYEKTSEAYIEIVI